MSGVGLVLILLSAWGMSDNRRVIPWRAVGGGLLLQLALAGVMFLTPAGGYFKAGTNAAFEAVRESVSAGAGFVFGAVYDDNSFAFFVLPSIIFFGSLAAVLDHWGVIPLVVRGLGFVLQKVLGVSGAESLAAGANVLAGQTEAPLFVKRYLPGMTPSELMSVMTGGFATVAGGVLVAYFAMGIDPGDLLTASLLSAPAALLLAKLIRPETGDPETAGGALPDRPTDYRNTLDAATAGAASGMRLALNVGAMMIAFLALIALTNLLLGAAGAGTDRACGLFGKRLIDPDWTLQKGLSYVFLPVAWAIGVPAADRPAVAELLGTKTVFNEFIAYLELTKDTRADMAALSPRGRTLAVYALCGFANLGSVGVQLGALSFLAPTKRDEVARLALPAMVAGTLAALMTACVAGMLMDVPAG